MTPPADRSPRRRLARRLIAGGLAAVALASSLAACSGDSEPATDTTTTAGELSGDSTTTQPAPTPGQPDELSAPLADPDATGRELAQRFLDILGSPTPGPLLEEFLSPAFQLQRSNGTFANKEEYVDQPASVARFTILEEGFRAYQEGPTLTVRFRVTIEEEINGEQLRATDADRLGVFIRTSAGWQLLAWSNFNPTTPP